MGCAVGALVFPRTPFRCCSSALSLICDDDDDFTSRFGRGMFRNRLGDWDCKGVRERVRGGDGDEVEVFVIEEAPFRFGFAQLLTRRKLSQLLC